MKEKIIVSDFDGTITTRDTLSTFLEEYAPKEWLILEDKWEKGEMGSAECLQKQFGLTTLFVVRYYKSKHCNLADTFLVLKLLVPV